MPRVRWAELLRRIFAVDPLACPRCRGRMGIVAVIIEPAVLTRILAHRARVRDPPPVTEPPTVPTTLTPADRGRFPSPVVPGPWLGGRSRARVSRRR